MTNFFLRAKHWQIFVLVWGTNLAGQVALMASLSEGPIKHPLRAGLFAEAVMAPFLFCFLGWLWSMGSFLFSISDPSLRLNLGFFRFAIIFPALYLFSALPFFLSSRSIIVESTLLPLHMFAFFCLIYTFYFDAKQLIIAEKGDAAERNDYLFPLFLLFFCIIGIWLIQPRINRLYAQEHASDASAGS